MHRAAAVELVRAEAQSILLRRLLKSSWPITDTERSWLRRGRNSAGPGPARLSGGAYGEASALEALLGALYLSDRERLQGLLDMLVVLSGDGKPQDEDASPVEWQAKTVSGSDVDDNDRLT